MIADHLTEAKRRFESYLLGQTIDNNMNYIEINDNDYTTVTRESDSDDMWDCDDTETDHNIESFSIVTPSDYWDLLVDSFELLPDTEYTLLYVIYSTGDSFCQTGGEIEYIGLYEKDKIEILNKNKKRIEEGSDSFTIHLFDNDNREYKFGTPWAGYFENLTSIETVNIKIK